MRCYAEQCCTLFSDDLELVDLFGNEVIEQVECKGARNISSGCCFLCEILFKGVYMDLKDCIEEIIKQNFSSGDYFDSHTIINLVLQEPKYHLAYLQEFHNKYSNCDVAQFHGMIAKNLIGTLKAIVEPVSGSAVTLNIYGGKPTKNGLWQRKKS